MTAVVGIDRRFADDLYVNVQALTAFGGSRNPNALGILGVANGLLVNRLSRTESGVSWAVIKEWNGQTVRAEINGIALFGRPSGLIQGRLSYKITDQTRITLGADLHHGRPATIFGARRHQDAVFFDVRWGY